MPWDLFPVLGFCVVTACPMASFICFCIHFGLNQSLLFPLVGTVTIVIDFFFVFAGLLATRACMALKLDFPLPRFVFLPAVELLPPFFLSKHPWHFGLVIRGNFAINSGSSSLHPGVLQVLLDFLSVRLSCAARALYGRGLPCDCRPPRSVL